RLLPEVRGENRSRRARAQSNVGRKPLRGLYECSRRILSRAAATVVETFVLVLDRLCHYGGCHYLYSLPGTDSGTEYFPVLSIPEIAQPLSCHSRSLSRPAFHRSGVQRSRHLRHYSHLERGLKGVLPNSAAACVSSREAA